mmetsp:Transcript_799/g.1880  ORF Transcript_799/g.1880 Transcript_799/m.1880 type:complete len:201 (+) Transcript_799:140-742(+)
MRTLIEHALKLLHPGLGGFLRCRGLRSIECAGPLRNRGSWHCTIALVQAKSASVHPQGVGPIRLRFVAVVSTGVQASVERRAEGAAVGGHPHLQEAGRLLRREQIQLAGFLFCPGQITLLSLRAAVDLHQLTRAIIRSHQRLFLLGELMNQADGILAIGFEQSVRLLDAWRARVGRAQHCHQSGGNAHGRERNAAAAARA